MSAKRKFSEFDAESSGPGEKYERAPGYQTPANKKNKGSSKVKPTSVNWTKKRARTIERLLKRKDSLPANVKNDLERELNHHKQKIDDLADEKKRKLMIKKYHMVRFFERKKADRLAKQIRSQLEATTDEEETKKLQADLHIAEVDALYAKYFPHRERYVSLYPMSSLGVGVQGGAKSENASTAARALHTERPPLWGTIEKAAKKGTAALTQIMERKLAVGSRSKLLTERPSEPPFAAKAGQLIAKTSVAPESADSRKGKGKQQKSPEEQLDSRSGDDSDGGFFEEG
ncbi:hypothetical protein F5Y19DRAFT_411394 [Xylariaceae sp. FL1651]|nr:hypothetical protein F5Y19DRAFT_411394 [Xylariaceae sp. FL1651]